MRAIDFPWHTTDKFSPTEWPRRVLEYMDDRIIYSLVEVREESGCPMWPSPVARAHVRHERSGSRHSTLNESRLADATDFFVRWGDAVAVLYAIMEHGSILGCGIYDSMIFRGAAGGMAMFHIDTRPDDVVSWWGRGRDPVEYIYMDLNELMTELENYWR